MAKLQLYDESLFDEEALSPYRKKVIIILASVALVISGTIVVSIVYLRIFGEQRASIMSDGTSLSELEPVSPSKLEELSVTVLPSVVRIEATGCQDQRYGTGFYVAPNFVITAAHVVAGASSIWIVDHKINNANGSVVFFDPQTDIAVIRVSRHHGIPLTLSSADSTYGYAVAAYYRSSERGPQMVVGEVGSKIGDTKDIYGRQVTQISMIQTLIPIARGDSGAPLVNSTGEVIGMAVVGQGDLMIAVSSRHLRLSMDRIGVAHAISGSGGANTGACV